MYSGTEGIQSQVTTSSGDVDMKVESGLAGDNNVSTSDAEPSSRAQLLEELKSRIRQLEAEGGTDQATSTQSPDEFKCLVCLVRTAHSNILPPRLHKLCVCVSARECVRVCVICC